jgi:hypothetical protein
MAVLGVMAVTVVIGLTITTATVNGLGVTSSNKALVQSRAAAQAGIAVAAAALPGSVGCPLSFPKPSAVPDFALTLVYLDSSGAPVVPAGNCFVAERVKITSTGTAESKGVNRAFSGDISVVEAIYGYTPALTPSVVASGAAIYLASGAGFNNGGTITSAATVPAVQVKTGDLACDNNTVITGNVVVVTGSISLKSCTVTGNAWAFGNTIFPPPGGVIGGILRAAGTKPGTHPAARWNPTMAMPSVPVWTEFGYDRNDWVTPAGVLYAEDVKPATAGNCAIPSSNVSGPVIFNALACGGASSPTTGTVVTLSNDLVVVAKQFNFNNSLDFRSSGTEPHRVWFITPDLTPTGNTATCARPAQGDFTIGQQFKIVEPITAMLYTPCAIHTGNGFTWRGQIYAGAISNWNNANFGYLGIGLPGANLDDGTYTPGGSSGSPTVLGALTSQRDLTDG